MSEKELDNVNIDAERLTEPNRTEPNRTEPNRTEPNRLRHIAFLSNQVRLRMSLSS